jgi:hypothetical protein
MLLAQFVCVPQFFKTPSRLCILLCASKESSTEELIFLQVYIIRDYEAHVIEAVLSPRASEHVSVISLLCNFKVLILQSQQCPSH